VSPLIVDSTDDFSELILICIQYDNATFISYKVNSKLGTLTLINQVKIPNIIIRNSVVDYNSRTLIALTYNVQPWIINKYTFQLFLIDSILIWEAEVPCDIDITLALSIFTYNSFCNRGLIIGN
jgi:hypothetical protein